MTELQDLEGEGRDPVQDSYPEFEELTENYEISQRVQPVARPKFTPGNWRTQVSRFITAEVHWDALTFKSISFLNKELRNYFIQLISLG
jgi:hypothetical protein